MDIDNVIDTHTIKHAINIKKKTISTIWLRFKMRVLWKCNDQYHWIDTSNIAQMRRTYGKLVQWTDLIGLSDIFV